ncbi:sensor domain-containing protein [uncultured Arenimonas sp.]|uniref:sensor domain-containing protein n=1 Tax=uncultured Arenimonas sp. TaxID=546226 RepID=UPI0030D9ED35
MTAATPKTIPDYLDQLRAALRGADPALVQDALYDAEEYLRSELAANPGMAEADVIASVATSYGAPEEVADIYRDTEVQVTRALRTPPAPPRESATGRFFGVVTDTRAWTALFYMLLSLATGIVYFTAVVTGFSLSASLALMIIGIPVVILFIGLVRVLSLVEGRIVEVLLGERMPRRPLYQGRGQPWLERIGAMFTDPRTWSTMLYQLLMLPLGIAYFTVTVTGMALSVGLVVGGLFAILGSFGLPVGMDWDGVYIGAPWQAALVILAGGLLFFAMLHLARLVGRGHGALAKNLLVKTAQH